MQWESSWVEIFDFRGLTVAWSLVAALCIGILGYMLGVMRERKRRS